LPSTAAWAIGLVVGVTLFASGLSFDGLAPDSGVGTPPVGAQRAA